MIYSLVSVEDRYKENPGTFQIPKLSDRTALKRRDAVKLIFQPSGGGAAERMWVEVMDRQEDVYKGILRSSPGFHGLKIGDPVEFQAEHVCDIRFEYWELSPDEGE